MNVCSIGRTNKFKVTDKDAFLELVGRLSGENIKCVEYENAYSLIIDNGAQFQKSTDKECDDYGDIFDFIRELQPLLTDDSIFAYGEVAYEGARSISSDLIIADKTNIGHSDMFVDAHGFNINSCNLQNIFNGHRLRNNFRPVDENGYHISFTNDDAIEKQIADDKIKDESEFTNLTDEQRKELSEKIKNGEIQTDSDVRDFAEEHNIPVSQASDFADRIRLDGSICSTCKNKAFAWNSYPCISCKRQPYLKDIYDKEERE